MDFNQIINRNNTGSVKWDFIERHFGDGAGKLLPMWVSDFDLPARLRFRRHCISESSMAYLAIVNVMRPILTPCFTGFRHATSLR